MSDLIVDTSASLSFSQRYRIVNPLTLVFCDSGLEQEYQINLATNIARQVRIALVLAFVLYLNFAFLDYLLVPELMWALWGIRAVTCSMLALLFFISFQPFFQRIHQQVIFTSSMVAATGIFAMLLITHNQYSHYYYAGINLCITWTLFIVGLRFMNAVQTVCLIVLLYNGIAFYKHLPLVDIISNNFFLVSNAIIGIFAGYTIEQHSRWQFYQSLVIKNNSSKLHSAMIAASLDAVITSDERGLVVEFNEAAERMFGYTREQALGQSIGELIVPDAMRARHDQGFRRFSEKGEPRVLGQRLELQAKRSDKSEFPVELTLRQVDLIGRSLVTAYIRDLTAQRTAEQEIVRQREVLQRNEKLAAMGTLLAGISHELNNPLAIVVGQAQLLQEVEHDPRILKRADKIRQAAERCATIITTFLSMARNQPPNCVPLDINELIKRVLELLQPKLREHQIEIRLRLGDDLPSVSVDADQVHQVISNLIINAQQAMQESPQKILRIESSVTADQSSLLVRIQDSGPGITPDVERRIFEPFFTTKAPGKGTGLGLAVCSGIVEAHGGRLELEPFTGEGACFRVSLPLHRA
jgi:PAS domain S-box-containing protein